ncbi:Gfo/Idh/MocA family oxidoreductase [bacterium]|nr:Gfo/Idh/MocA family oxidoreductase [bacterium]
MAVHDVDPDRALSFALEHNTEAVLHLQDLLANDHIDVVTVATPSGTHGTVAIPAAKAGKHIICEKPLETTLEKADAIIESCEENKVFLAAVFQSRFGRIVQLIKKAIDAGRFGKLILASAQVKWYRSADYYASAGWRGTWELDGGGVLMNQSIHIIDLLLYLVGNPREVFAYTDLLTHAGLEVEDTACAAIRFENGAMGVIEASTSCAPGFPRKLEISGQNGSIVLEDDRLIRWQFTEEYPEDREIRRKGEISEGLHSGAGDPKAAGYKGHKQQFQDMARAILEKREPLISGREGRRALELICGIYESAESGLPYRFSE